MGTVSTTGKGTRALGSRWGDSTRVGATDRGPRITSVLLINLMWGGCRRRAVRRSSKRQRDGRPPVVAHCAPTMGAKGGVGALLVPECCRMADQSTMESCR